MQYDKAEIGRISKENGFVRDTFEKVLRLTKILGYINEHELLSAHLLLKGGTAINLAIFNLPRLSVDIDLDYIPNDKKEDMLICRESIRDVIERYMTSEGYLLMESSRFSLSLDAFHFQYINCTGNRDSIKLEINYSLRAHVLEPVKCRVLPEIIANDKDIQIVAPMEIFAAKGNALLNRTAARDLYDWNNLINAKLFESERDLFRKCFIFYTTISAEINDVNSIFDVSAIDALTINKIKRDLFPVINCRHHYNLELQKAQAKEYISALVELTESEQEYVERFIAKEYRPDLLFDDSDIVARIEKHPMALWKCKK